MARISKRECTITYYRVNWHQGEGVRSLENVLTACLSKLPNADDTCIQLGDGKAKICHRQVSNGKLKLHIAKWTERENASTVPIRSRGVNSNLGKQPPGNDWDYLDGDGVVLVSEDHYLVTGIALRPSSVINYIRRLFKHAAENNGHATIVGFDLVSVADPDIVARVQKEGVKRLELDIGQYMEKLNSQVEQMESKTILQNLSNNALMSLMSLITKPGDRELIEKAENLSAKIIISIDGRKPGRFKVGDLAKVASAVSQEDDESSMTLVTGKNTRIKQGQLVLKKKVNITAENKSVNYNELWGEMEQYLDELSSSGNLEL